MARDALHRHIGRVDRRRRVGVVLGLAVARLAVEAARRVHVQPEGDVVQPQVVVDCELREGVRRPAAVVVQPVVRHPARGGRLREQVVGRGGRWHRGVPAGWEPSRGLEKIFAEGGRVGRQEWGLDAHLVEDAEAVCERRLDRHLVPRVHLHGRRAARARTVQRRVVVALWRVRCDARVGAFERELALEGVVARAGLADVRGVAARDVDRALGGVVGVLWDLVAFDAVEPWKAHAAEKVVGGVVLHE